MPETKKKRGCSVTGLQRRTLNSEQTIQQPPLLPSTLSSTSLEGILNPNCTPNDTECKYTPITTISDTIEMIKWVHDNPSATFFNAISETHKDFCDLNHDSVALIFNDLPNKDVFFNQYPNPVSEGGREMYSECAVYCKDSECSVDAYLEHNQDIISGHCNSLYVLQPGVVGLLENYQTFTMSEQTKANDPTQTETIMLPYGIEDEIMCLRLKIGNLKSDLG